MNNFEFPITEPLQFSVLYLASLPSNLNKQRMLQQTVYLNRSLFLTLIYKKKKT